MYIENFKKYLTHIDEGSPSNYVFIDVQPHHEIYFKRYLKKYLEIIETAENNNIIMVFNGEDLGMDSKQDVIDWLYDEGIEESILDNIFFVEKEYGFFRGWTDIGISDSLIIKTIKFLQKNNLYNTYDLRGMEKVQKIYKRF